MKTAFIFHGTGGYPEENWFPWLKEKFEEKGYQVFVPQFPTPEGQSIESWLKVLESYKQYITEDTIFVGHSLGGIFLLKYLEQLEHPVKAAAFVGSAIGIPPVKNFDADSKFSEGFAFDWAKIRSKSKNFIVFQSDNDPYVGLANGEKLAKELGVELSFVPSAGHFNVNAGYTKFEELWEKLLPILAS